jgi:hypothetical protein
MTTSEIRMQCLHMAISAGYRDPVGVADFFIDYVTAKRDGGEDRSGGISCDGVQSIIGKAAKMHGMDTSVVMSACRTAPVVAARDDAIVAVARSYPQYGLSDLGRIFNRDHTSILAALRRNGAWTPRKQAA